jgi:DNA-binding MarR family transcriptional regulator
VSAALEKLLRESNLETASCVLRHVTRTSRLTVAAFDAALSPAGLTGNQFSVLITLARSGPMNVQSLATAVGMHSSTTPRVIAPLDRKGLVCTRVGADKRQRLISITGKGNERLLRAYPRWAEVQRGILNRLGEQEWSSAMDVLRDIRSALRAQP